MKKQGRFYEIDGLKLPSVTTILGAIAKPALVNWASYGARDATLARAREVYTVAGPGLTPASFEAAVRKLLGKGPAHFQAKGGDAAEIGTLVHARIEAEIRRELGEDVAVPEVPEQEVDGSPHPAWNAYQSYLAWRRDHEVRPVQTELRVYSKVFGYAGTVDLLAYVADELTIADYKTSKAVYGEYRLQIAAYREAFLEMRELGPVPLGGLILRFPKEADDAFEAHPVPWSEQAELMTVFRSAQTLWEWMA